MAVMHGNFNFELVWEILPIQLTIQPGTTHCHQKFVSKYSRNTKKLDVTRWGALHCISLRRENRAQKFPSVLVRIFDDNGSPKTKPYL